MARSNYRKAVKAKEKEEKKNTQVVCCMDCFWANLFRYGSNPILAQCRKKPNPYDKRFPYQVEVASAKWVCPLYMHQEEQKFVQIRIKAA